MFLSAKKDTCACIWDLQLPCFFLFWAGAWISSRLKVLKEVDDAEAELVLSFAGAGGTAARLVWSWPPCAGGCFHRLVCFFCGFGRGLFGAGPPFVCCLCCLSWEGSTKNRDTHVDRVKPKWPSTRLRSKFSCSTTNGIGKPSFPHSEGLCPQAKAVKQQTLVFVEKQKR